MRPDKRKGPGGKSGAPQDRWAATENDSTPSVWSELGGNAGPRLTPTDHRVCTPRCREAAVPSPLERDRPPMVACSHCGAPEGVACTVRAQPRMRLTKFGRFHPSRLEGAA